MTIVLGQHQYGKAQTRVVRVCRDTARHEIRDLNVSTSLQGEFADAYVAGDQASILPTDSQKNAVFAYARDRGIGEIEDYALALASHFVRDIPPVSRAQVSVDEYRWERVAVAGTGHAHTFVRAGQEVRTTAVTVDAGSPAAVSWVVSGIKDIALLKSTGSQFTGFFHDSYTTLEEASDRILATSLTARWRYLSASSAWSDAFSHVRQILLERFAEVHSLGLQHTLWEMGSAVVAARDDIAEIRMSAPNAHHFLVNLTPFGLDNPGQVFHAADRPYGLIQAAVVRAGAPPAGPAWDSPASFA